MRCGRWREREGGSVVLVFRRVRMVVRRAVTFLTCGSMALQRLGNASPGRGLRFCVYRVLCGDRLAPWRTYRAQARSRRCPREPTAAVPFRGDPAGGSVRRPGALRSAELTRAPSRRRFARGSWRSFIAGGAVETNFRTDGAHARPPGRRNSGALIASNFRRGEVANGIG